MSEGNQYEIATVPLESVADALSKTLPFAGLTISDFGMLGPVERIEAPAGCTLTEPKEVIRGYGIVLQGEIRAERVEPDGSRTLVWTGRAGEGFGEGFGMRDLQRDGLPGVQVFCFEHRSHPTPSHKLFDLKTIHLSHLPYGNRQPVRKALDVRSNLIGQ